MKNEVQVLPTKKKCAYTIRIVICDRVFNMGTGGYGLTYAEAVEEGKNIATRMDIDFNPCEQVDTSIDRYPPM